MIGLIAKLGLWPGCRHRNVRLSESSASRTSVRSGSVAPDISGRPSPRHPGIFTMGSK